MNKVILMGRLTRDPDIRSTAGDRPMTIARYTIAVDRRMRRDAANNNQQTADFISCVAFGKTAEFIEKYCFKGTKLVVSGRIQTGSYTNKEGQKVYTTDVVVEEAEFAESKAAAAGNAQSGNQTNYQNYQKNNQKPDPGSAATPDFINIPDGVEDEGLPFH